MAVEGEVLANGQDHGHVLADARHDNSFQDQVLDIFRCGLRNERHGEDLSKQYAFHCIF